MRRLVLLVGAVVFVDTTFFAAITPLLPHYADELGLTKTSAGVLTATFPAGVLVGSLPGGWLAARVGVKPTVLAGLALLGITSIAFGFGRSALELDAARFLQGIGSAFSWCGAMAWLVRAVPRERRGEAIGGALAAAIAAGLAGPAVGVVAERLGTEPVFSSVAVVACALAVWTLRTPAPAPTGAGLRGLRGALHDRRVLTGAWIVVIPGLLFGTLDVLVPLRFDRLGATATAVGATFIAAALLEAIVTPLTGRLSDRRGRVVPLRAGLLASAVMIVTLGLPGRPWPLAVLTVLTAPAIGLLWAPSMAMLSEGAEDLGMDQGIAFALTNLTWGLGQAVGAAAGGATAQATSDLVPYAAAAGVCLLTLVTALHPRRSVAGYDGRLVAGLGDEAGRG
jgi:MFS family permease